MAETPSFPRNTWKMPRQDTALEESVEDATAVLEEVIFQNRLGTRTKFFVQRGEVYHRGGARASDTDPVDKIADEMSNVEVLEAGWTADFTSKLATMTERAVVVMAGLCGWLGNRMQPKLAARTDDVRRKNDFWGTWYAEGLLPRAAGFDTTMSARSACQKIANALPAIHRGELHGLVMGEISSETHGIDMRGQVSFLPHFELVVSKRHAIRIKELFEQKEWQVLATYPLQVELLEQMLAQARLYRAYAASISLREVPRKDGEKMSGSEYRQKLLGKGYADRRLSDEKWRKQKMVAIFDQCIEHFSRALNERRGVVERAKQNGSPTAQAILSSYRPDTEHVKFMRTFQRINTKGEIMMRSPLVLRGVLATRPPVRRNRSTGQKEPEYPPRNLQRALRGGDK